MVRGTQPGVSPGVTGVSSGVKSVLLFLMFAVFVWGLHIKLSHYSPSISSSNSVSGTVKLLRDKSVEHSPESYAEDVANDRVEREEEVPIFSAIHVVTFSQLALYQVELSLCSSCRYDSDGSNSMHLPPPAIS
jgi:hypothetical protein